MNKHIAPITSHDAPSMCIEFHRYTKPTDGYVFIYLDPSTLGGEIPFATADDDGPTYNSRLEGWGESFWADPLRADLIETGYQPVAWDDLPAELRHYVIFCQAPIQWHQGLAENDPELVALVTVWALVEPGHGKHAKAEVA